ncbi:MAG: hypothetical protein U0894_20830 [Pirellulales bacterium]
MRVNHVQTIHWAAIKILAAASIAVSFSSCSPDNRQGDLKQCIAGVDQDTSAHSIPDISPSDRGEVLHDKLGAAIAGCMSEKGYGHTNHDMTDERCVDDVDFNAFCYQRSK